MVDIWNTNHGVLVEWRRQGKTRIYGERSVILPLCAMQNSHRKIWEKSRTYVLTSRRLTVWAVARPLITLPEIVYVTCIKVKQSRNRAGVAQRVPGGLDSQISMTFGTWRWWSRQPHGPGAFTPRKYSWCSFSLGAESTPGPWYGRKEYKTEKKSSDSTGNRSRDRPTSRAAP
jgi:hypothetical protein